MRRDIDSTEVKHLYLDKGQNTREIAEYFNCSYSLIPYRLKNASVSMRGRKGIEDKIVNGDEIRRLYLDEGRNILETAQILGYSTTLIKYRLLKMGIHKPKERRARTKNKRGYILIYNPDHPRSDRNKGYVLEHIVKWEESHNKSLPKGWVIHHVDGVKSHNDSENLVAYPRMKHERLIPMLLSRIKSLKMENDSLKAKQGLLFDPQGTVEEEIM